MRPTLPQGMTRAVAWATVLAASLGVLMLYSQPDFLVLVAEQVWACF